MRRAWALLVLMLLVFSVRGGFDASKGAASSAASPVPGLWSATPFAVGEMPGAVSVSLVIQNMGAIDERLLGASTPAATRVETHTSLLHHGVRQMLPVAGLTIPAGGTIILEPESDHLMLVGLREDLVQGRSFPLTLHFAQAGDIPVTGRVRRKVDAAGLTPIPPVSAGDLTISLASAPPAPASEATTP